MDEKLIHKTTKRLEQICSSLVSDGWRQLVSYEERGHPHCGFSVLRTFRHERGGMLTVNVEGATIEIWRNGRLKKSETIAL